MKATAKTKKTTDRSALARTIKSCVIAGFLPILILTVTMSSSRASIEAVRIATGFSSPLYVCAPPGDTSRIFGDCFGPDPQDFLGRVFTLEYHGGVVSNFQEITSQLFPTRIGGYTLGSLTSLGEDASGEIYLVDYSGNVFKIRGGPQ